MMYCSNIYVPSRLWTRNHQLPFITSLIEMKLDLDTVLEWQKASQDSADVPHYAKLLEFLNLRAQASESASSKSRKSTRNDYPLTKKYLPNRSTSLVTNTSGTTVLQIVFCVKRKSIHCTHVLASRPCLMTRWLQQSRRTTPVWIALSLVISPSNVPASASPGNVRSHTILLFTLILRKATKESSRQTHLLCNLLSPPVPQLDLHQTPPHDMSNSCPFSRWRCCQGSCTPRFCFHDLIHLWMLDSSSATA